MRELVPRGRFLKPRLDKTACEGHAGEGHGLEPGTQGGQDTAVLRDWERKRQ